MHDTSKMSPGLPVPLDTALPRVVSRSLLLRSRPKKMVLGKREVAVQVEADLDQTPAGSLLNPHAPLFFPLRQTCREALPPREQRRSEHEEVQPVDPAQPAEAAKPVEESKYAEHETPYVDTKKNETSDDSMSKEDDASATTEQEMVGVGESLKAKGGELFRAGRLQQAKAQYKKVVKMFASLDGWQDAVLRRQAKALWAFCNLNLAAVALKHEDYLEAKYRCAAFLEYEPQNVKALFRMAQAELGRGDYQSAMALCRNVLEIEDGNADATALHAKAQKLQREEGKKLKLPHDNTCVGPEELEPAEGSLDLELRKWRRVLDATPTNVHALKRAALAAAGLELFDEALSFCSRGLALRPQDLVFQDVQQDVAQRKAFEQEAGTLEDIEAIREFCQAQGKYCSRAKAVSALHAAKGDWMKAVMNLTA